MESDDSETGVESAEEDSVHSGSSGDASMSSPGAISASGESLQAASDGGSEGSAADNPADSDGAAPPRRRRRGPYQKYLADQLVKVPRTTKWRDAKRRRLQPPQEQGPDVPESESDNDLAEDIVPPPQPAAAAAVGADVAADSDDMVQEREAAGSDDDNVQLDHGLPDGARTPSSLGEPAEDSDADEPPWDPHGDTTSASDSNNSSSGESEPEEEDMNDFDSCVAALNKPLHRYTAVTLGKAILGLALIFIKFKISKACLLAIIQLICQILPISHKLPKTLYKFFKLVFSISPQRGSFIRHVLCGNPLCNQYLGIAHGSSPCECQERCNIPEQCETCESCEKAYFLECSIENSVTHMFEKLGLSDIIDKNVHEPAANTHKDVRDGSLYKSLLRSKYDLTLISNVDGIPVAHSSKASIWSVLSTICEIPVKLRSKFMLFSGLWFGTYKPNMNSYLKPFVDRLVTLGTTGLRWVHPRTHVQYVCKVYAIFFSVDAQARAPMQNMHTHGGDCGCGRCEHSGAMVPVGRGHARVYTYKVNPPPTPRTHASFLDYALQAAEENTIVKGIKGVSVCARLPGIDMAKSFFPEPLHQAHLGAGRQILNAFCDTSNHRKPFYLTRDKKITFNTRMAAIKTPDTIKRKPRSLDELPHWKGSEFHNFILYYSLECLSGLIPAEYLQHWMLFVNAMYFFSKTGVTDTELELSRSFIEHFCNDFERLYGVESCTYNIHNLLHFSATVKEVAPFGEISAYIFEDANGILKSMRHGTMHAAEELANSIELLNATRTLKYNLEEPSEKKSAVCGRSVELNTFPQAVQNYATVELSENDHKYFQRAVVRNCKYSSLSYTRSTKSCRCYVQYENAGGGQNIGVIVLFAHPHHNAHDVRCLLQKVHCDPAAFSHVRFQYAVPHMFQYTLLDEFVVINSEKFIQPVIKCIDHLCVPPNVIEINM